MRRRSITPVGAMVRGAIAGAAGTAAMDAVQYLLYRSGGGKDTFVDWETSAGLEDWESAPAPAQVAKRIVEALTRQDLPPDKARIANNAMHWATGIGWASAYGVLAGSLPNKPRIRSGLLWGVIVWGSGYVLLPATGLYKPIWEYDLKTLAKDLGAHLAYGLTTASAFRILS